MTGSGLHAHLRLERPGFALDVALEVDGGEVLAVVGPNGAGKSTLLRMVAGLAVPGSSTSVVRIDGTDVSDRPAEERPVGMAFQDLRLFPHLDALGNVAFPLRARGLRRADAAERARVELAAAGASEVAARRPGDLSGGEAQRVALARALVAEPAVLLLDEPFAAVDAEFRTTARAALADRLRGFGGVTVVVTHDPADALLLGHRVLVLEDGCVTQDAPAGEVARRPASRYAANLVGTNLLAAAPHGRACTTAAGTEVVLAEEVAGRDDIKLIIPPSAVALHAERPTGTPRNVWPVTVRAVELLGSRARVVVALPASRTSAPPDELVAEVTLSAVDDLGIATDLALWASVKATEIAAVGGGLP